MSHVARAAAPQFSVPTAIAATQKDSPRVAPAFLLGVGSAAPAYSATQEQALEFMERVAAASLPPGEARAMGALLKRIYTRSAIKRRHSVLPDYVASSPQEFSFYPKNHALEPQPTTAARMAAFEREAPGLAIEAANAALASCGVSASQVTHLVISTCTGFFAPGLDTQLIERLGMSRHVQRTLLGFMGCYAGVSGIRVCREIAASQPGACVLQVAVELCSLHYQKDFEPDTLVANALFADGAAAAVYGGSSLRDQHSVSSVPALEVLRTATELHPGTSQEMSWRIGDTGFVMRLDAKVPQAVADACPGFVKRMLHGMPEAQSPDLRYAIHPGGRRIVEAAQQALGIEESQVAASLGVLRDYGNMSSATILFVLQRLMRKEPTNPHPIVALAFGPGLTTEGALLRPV